MEKIDTLCFHSEALMTLLPIALSGGPITNTFLQVAFWHSQIIETIKYQEGISLR
ncbi:MAG: hypothetical protein RMJ66_07740 [Bacteroidia bacterium]|nr:hypothetical protein [Bacteroidia bacterium]MDW8134939.1 hypothetical protein [Bacteroidia bacterium]